MATKYSGSSSNIGEQNFKKTKRGDASANIDTHFQYWNYTYACYGNDLGWHNNRANSTHRRLPRMISNKPIIRNKESITKLRLAPSPHAWYEIMRRLTSNVPQAQQKQIQINLWCQPSSNQFWTLFLYPKKINRASLSWLHNSGSSEY